MIVLGLPLKILSKVDKFHVRLFGAREKVF